MHDNRISWEEAVRRLRDDPEQQDLVRHCYYDDPVEQAAERFAESEEWQEILQLLGNRKPSSVLDIGAGRGISSYAFARSGYSVTALEPDQSELVGVQAIKKLFSKTGQTVTIVGEKGECLPFADGVFDIVYGRAVCHHADELKKFCAEALRVLKPGGIFLMTREHVISRKEDLQKFLESHPLHRMYGGEKAYLLEEYSDAIRSSGIRNFKAIGPFESAINYAPMTTEQFQQMIVRMYAGILGRRFAEWVAVRRVCTKWWGRRLSKKYDEPGRLYTFWAEK